MKAANLDVTPVFIGKDDLDGEVFTSSGHALGNRTEIPFKVAGKVLQETRRSYPTDFELRDELVSYPVTGGAFVVSYSAGYPVGRFDSPR